jgi:hypothetical protein
MPPRNGAAANQQMPASSVFERDLRLPNGQTGVAVTLRSGRCGCCGRSTGVT